MPKAIIVGSGPGGSVMAMELAEAGWDVVIFEMGPSYYTNIEGQGPFGTVFSNDELKSQYRYFEQPDPLAYPRTFRQTASQNAANTYVGDVNDLPNQVGGAFPHSDVKVTRMWDIDFKGLSLLGPVPGADMADWPFEYSELAPYYDEVETVIGVQGDVASIPAFVQKHQPQSKPFPMPPGAQMRSSMLLAAGAKRLGLHPFHVPDGGQFGRIQRLPGLQQLRILFRATGVQSQPSRSTSSCCGGRCTPGGRTCGHRRPSPRSTTPAVGPPASPLSTRRAMPVGKAPTWLCCPAPRS